MRTQDMVGAIHQLEEKGMSRSQAEVIAGTVAVAVEHLAAKEDLRAAENRLDEKIDVLREDTKNRIDALRKEMQDGFKVQREQTNAQTQSTKVWLLAVNLSIVALAIQIGNFSG